VPFNFRAGENPVEQPTGYDTAQICLNGHVINDGYNWCPQHNADHCSQCGQKTIIECPKCHVRIPGNYHVQGIGTSRRLKCAPAFCHGCGNGYPWTESRLSAAREYVRELERLDANDRGILDRTLDDLVRDTPNTPVAALRFKQLVVKAGPVAMEALKTILIEIMAEPAKRAIWG
jgi:hypothetical protein